MGTLNLPTQLAFPNHLRGPFLLRAPLERQKEGNGLGSLLLPGVPQTLAQRPWLQASKGGGGGGEAAWPQCDLQRPPEKGTWPLPAQNCPSQCPQPWRGYEISDPFALWGPGGVEGIGGMLAEGNRGAMEMGKGLRQRPLGMGVPEGAAVAGCPSGILETVI